ncbi:MAG: glycosyltransferase [Patescibacteria group bacterium]|nr:glycosyltransferase [Patescibacteria group bacterium]
MRKILFVITKSNWGGAQRYVFDLAANLPKDYFDAAVAFGGTGGENAPEGLLAQKLKEKNIRTIYIESFVRDVSLRTDFAALRELRALYQKEKPDIVHLNSSKAGGLGALAARMAGVKRIIFTAHGWPFWENRNIVARSLIWIFSWLTVLLSHQVIVISEYDLKVARRMPFCKRKICLIYNGINPQMQFGSGEKIRSAFPQGARIIGTIGELNKNKNQQALIEEAKNNQNLFVAIVGEGEERRALEKKIRTYGLESRVKLFGFMLASEALRGFDVFTLPSIKEGLPYVLLEAKTAGLPVVANRVGGVGEILDAKDMGKFSLERMIAETLKVYNRS